MSQKRTNRPRSSSRLLAPAFVAALVTGSVDTGSSLDIFGRAPVRRIVGSLSGADPLESSAEVLELATSPRASLRLAAALALAEPVAVVAAEWCIEALAVDPNAAVREAVVAAALAQRACSPDSFAGLLTRLARDPVAAVRRAARAALT